MNSFPRQSHYRTGTQENRSHEGAVDSAGLFPATSRRPPCAFTYYRTYRQPHTRGLPPGGGTPRPSRPPPGVLRPDRYAKGGRRPPPGPYGTAFARLQAGAAHTGPEKLLGEHLFRSQKGTPPPIPQAQLAGESPRSRSGTRHRPSQTLRASPSGRCLQG